MKYSNVFKVVIMEDCKTSSLVWVQFIKAKCNVEIERYVKDSDCKILYISRLNEVDAGFTDKPIDELVNWFFVFFSSFTDLRGRFGRVGRIGFFRKSKNGDSRKNQHGCQAEGRCFGKKIHDTLLLFVFSSLTISPSISRTIRSA